MTQEQYENLLSEMKTFIKKEIETSQKKLKKEIEETITQKLTETNEEIKSTEKSVYKCANRLLEHHIYTEDLIQNNAQRQAEANRDLANIAYSSR